MDDITLEDGRHVARQRLMDAITEPLVVEWGLRKDQVREAEESERLLAQWGGMEEVASGG